jgi:hypothetical protein
MEPACRMEIQSLALHGLKAAAERDRASANSSYLTRMRRRYLKDPGIVPAHPA